MSAIETINEKLAQLPLYDYRLFDANMLETSEAVRVVCEENDCGMYDASWCCPPAVGTYEQCVEKLRAYKRALLFSTIWQPVDVLDLNESLELKKSHEAVTREVVELFSDEGVDNYALTSGCSVCDECAWPNACRFPKCAIPNIESHGVVLYALTEKLGMETDFTNGFLPYFGLVLFNDK
jgi:predicted metal-binding protein